MSPVIPKALFDLSSLKNIITLRIDVRPHLAQLFVQINQKTDFDDESLISLPKLQTLGLGECAVTGAGLNVFLKQFIAGERRFTLVVSTLIHSV